jgi:alpha-tubulin suppressor-like RCC1 family protein
MASQLRGRVVLCGALSACVALAAGAQGLSACVTDSGSPIVVVSDEAGADGGGGAFDASTGDGASVVDASNNADGGAVDGGCAVPCSGTTCFEGVCGGNGVVDIASGVGNACVVLASGSVWCWGAGAVGQLGVPPTALAATSTCGPFGGAPCRPQPERVAGLKDIVQVSIGNHACAVAKNGDVYCWGSNTFGQLGHAPGVGDATCQDHSNSVVCNPTPTKVSGISNVSKVAVGEDQTCALAGGKMYCWGDDDTLALGQGNTTPSELNTATAVKGLPGNIVDFDIATEVPQVCAVSATDGVYCWGYNYDLQLGHPATNPNDVMVNPFPGTCSSTPTAITGNGALVGAVMQVATSYGVTCVREGLGKVFCFGASRNGGLGTGGALDAGSQLLDTSTPVLTTAATISGRSQYGNTFCAAAQDGHISCWGGNAFGADAGVPLQSCSGALCVTAPVQLPAPLVKKISVGFETALALGIDGKVYAWGQNAFGELTHTPNTAGDSLCSATSPCNPTPTVVTGLP